MTFHSIEQIEKNFIQISFVFFDDDDEIREFDFRFCIDEISIDIFVV